MTRRRKQTDSGSVSKSNGAWFVRFYTGEIERKENGATKYKTKSIRLGATNDPGLQTKDARNTAAQAAIADYRKSNGMVSFVSDTAMSSSTTVGRYFQEVVVPWWNRKLENGALKPSTIYGYQKIWRLYLQPKLDSVLIGQFTMGNAGRLLDGFAKDGLNTNCISHIRNVASEIFAHAATSEVIPANPFAGAKMLEAAKPPKPTHKYTLSEIRSILLALRGNTQSQVAVGLTFFAGLRPGEARAVRWESYDGRKLKIEHSVWRKHETAPKTRESVQSLPVAGPLRLLLSELHREAGSPTEGYILRGSNGGALNLDHLARVTIKPLLKLAGLEWHGITRGVGDWLPWRPMRSKIRQVRRGCFATRRLIRQQNSISA